MMVRQTAIEKKTGLNELRVGIVGGGQLGKMLILEGKKMGIRFTILDPHPQCPASSIADEHLVCRFDDSAGFHKLAHRCDVITYEFEHIDAHLLIELESLGHSIAPSPHILKIIQDKYHQKKFLQERNIPVPSFERVDSLEHLQTVVARRFGFPVFLKSRRGGYDGKGNYLVQSENDLIRGFSALWSGPDSLMVEHYVPFQMEVSSLVARGKSGDAVVYPLAENEHRNNILHSTIVPARLSTEVARKAEKMAEETMGAFGGIGIFCIEMFVTGCGDILLNEVAPRNHNSGHYSIEACVTSQFSQHLRGILGLPLGSTDLLKPVVMINLLGEEGYSGRGKIVGYQESLRIPGVSVHYYGKVETRPYRKMGHLTVLADTIEAALEQAVRAKKLISVISEEG